MISKEELLRIMPYAKLRVDTFLSPLNTVLEEYGIVTPLRMAAFLAQLAHESGEFRYVEELASGQAYEGRKDLGNLEVGDGEKFKGRGLIQITGRDNYRKCSLALFDDERLLDTPDLLRAPVYAVECAGWFWDTHHLNGLADKKDFRGITRVINGGYNGYADRVKYYERALLVLGDTLET